MGYFASRDHYYSDFCPIFIIDSLESLRIYAYNRSNVYVIVYGYQIPVENGIIPPEREVIMAIF